jgi:hypothetical protein
MSNEQSKWPDWSKWTPWEKCSKPQRDEWISFINAAISSGRNIVLGKHRNCWYHGIEVARRKWLHRKYGMSKVHVIIHSDECKNEVQKLLDEIVRTS